MRSLANSSAAASPPAPTGAARTLRIDPGDGLAWPPDLKLLVDPIAAAVHDSTGMTGAVALSLTDDTDMARLNQTFAGRAGRHRRLGIPQRRHRASWRRGHLA